MWYRGSVEVEAGQTQADPAEETVAVCRGTISQFYRLFPPGCAGKVSLQVLTGTRQIFPTTPGTYYLGDGSEVLGPASVILDEPEYALTLRAWAPEADYDHVIYCEFYIEKTVIYVPVVVESAFVPVPAGLSEVS